MTQTSDSISTFRHSVFDLTDHRLIDQVGLALLVLDTSEEPQSRRLAEECLRDIHTQIGCRGSVQSFLGLLSCAVISHEGSHQDRGQVFGSIALILDLLFASPGIGGQPNCEVTTEEPAPRPDETGQADLPVISSTANAQGEPKQSSKRTENSSDKRKQLLSEGWRPIVAPNGKKAIYATLAQCLQTEQVIALRDTGACVEVRDVDGHKLLLSSQVRGLGTKRTRQISSNPSEGNLVAHFEFFSREKVN